MRIFFSPGIMFDDVCSIKIKVKIKSDGKFIARRFITRNFLFKDNLNKKKMK